MITDTIAPYEFSGELGAAMERGIERLAGQLLELGTPVPALELSAQTPALAATHHPLGKPGGPGLFHKKGLQLPAYIQNIAHALIRSGHSESQAIQLAIGVCKRWARGGGKVTPEVRAAAQAAIAEWERDKASAHLSNPAGDAIELAGVYTEALHPRAAGGKFGAKPTAAAPPKSGGKLVSEPIGGDSGRKAQLHALADQDREVARGLLIQARGLQRQLHALRHPGGGKAAGGGTAGAPGKNAAPGKKKSRSSTKTKAGKPHNKTKKRATTASKEAGLSNRIKSLTSDARKLMAAADRLDRRAASI
jgi:hypothetical protein